MTASKMNGRRKQNRRYETIWNGTEKTKGSAASPGQNTLSHLACSFTYLRNHCPKIPTSTSGTSRTGTQPTVILRITALGHKIESKLAIVDIVIGGIEVRHTPAILAAVFHDPWRQAFDVLQRRTSGILQIGTDGGLMVDIGRGIDAGDLLLVVELTVVGAGLDVGVETGGGGAFAAVAFAAALAVDA